MTVPLGEGEELCENQTSASPDTCIGFPVTANAVQGSVAELTVCDALVQV